MLPHLLDLKLIRDRVVDALRDAIISGRLKRGARIREHEHNVSALRRRDLTTVQHLRRAHLLRFYENVAPLPVADRPANA